MYAPTPSSIQAHEYRRQEMLAHAAEVRFVADVRRSRTAATAETIRLRPASTVSHARSLVASLISVAFAMTTKQPGVSASHDA
jgi:hypothetical protein